MSPLLPAAAVRHVSRHATLLARALLAQSSWHSMAVTMSFTPSSCSCLAQNNRKQPSFITFRSDTTTSSRLLWLRRRLEVWADQPTAPLSSELSQALPAFPPCTPQGLFSHSIYTLDSPESLRVEVSRFLLGPVLAVSQHLSTVPRAGGSTGLHDWSSRLFLIGFDPCQRHAEHAGAISTVLVLSKPNSLQCTP